MATRRPVADRASAVARPRTARSEHRWPVRECGGAWLGGTGRKRAVGRPSNGGRQLAIGIGALSTTHRRHRARRRRTRSYRAWGGPWWSGRHDSYCSSCSLRSYLGPTRPTGSAPPRTRGQVFQPALCSPISPTPCTVGLIWHGRTRAQGRRQAWMHRAACSEVVSGQMESGQDQAITAQPMNHVVWGSCAPFRSSDSFPIPGQCRHLPTTGGTQLQTHAFRFTSESWVNRGSATMHQGTVSCADVAAECRHVVGHAPACVGAAQVAADTVTLDAHDGCWERRLSQRLSGSLGKRWVRRRDRRCGRYKSS